MIRSSGSKNCNPSVEITRSSVLDVQKICLRFLLLLFMLFCIRVKVQNFFGFGWGALPPRPPEFWLGGLRPLSPPLDGFSRGAAAPRTPRVFFFPSDDTGAARTSGRSSRVPRAGRSLIRRPSSEI